jgi:hypothetical protein
MTTASVMLAPSISANRRASESASGFRMLSVIGVWLHVYG